MEAALRAEEAADAREDEASEAESVVSIPADPIRVAEEP